MKKFTCIVCPISCNLQVDENNGEILVTGNQCKRGMKFGIAEYTSPVRMLTTTVKTKNGTIARLPVISSSEVPKKQLKSIVEELYKITVECPIKRGDIVVKNIGNTGVDIIATRTIQ